MPKVPCDTGKEVMNMVLTIAGTDVSTYIDENAYTVHMTPVYDEQGGFVNIYGEKIHERTGRMIRIKARLRGVPDTTAAAIAAALEGDTVTVTADIPAQVTFTAAPGECAFDLHCDRGGNIWDISLEVNGYDRDCL